tara:strand:- start:41 stop:2335 length:2295 start_codon:yes stop_codon:yes gene_type:complete
MSNTFYIDCNRKNSQHSTTNNNEWTYKLNTEMLLPKGTDIQIQTSFVNKKGINGGSIEIDDDIVEEITYTFYITEHPQHLPDADNGKDPTVPWFRTCLGCDTETFRGNFDETISETSMAEINSIVKGYWIDTSTQTKVELYNSKFKSPNFGSFGGCGQVCPQIKWVADTGSAGGMRCMPVIKTILIGIPKGVYGIGEIGQLIEDQFNGVRYYDETLNKIISEDGFTKRKTDLQGYTTNKAFDGQMFNGPFVDLTTSQERNYSTSTQAPTDGDEMFLCGNDYSEMMELLKFKCASTADDPAQGSFDILPMQGNPVDDAQRAASNGVLKIRPFYTFINNWDGGDSTPPTTYSPQVGHIKDGNLNGSEYWLYQYDADEGNYQHRLVGTTNFSFKYDSEKNGFSINGLHNAVRSPSHDRFGSKMESSGQPVINFKKVRRGAFDDHNWKGTSAQRASRLKVIGALNCPETRDMGVMILNWGGRTSKKLANNKNHIFTDDCAKFEDYFETEKSKLDAWKQTIWYRLGFDFDQLNDISTHKNLQYNKSVYNDYGFTTDVQLTNDIIPTLSTLSNPNEFKPDGPDGADPVAGTQAIAGFQFFKCMNYAMPFSSFQAGGVDGLYANSLYAETASYPTIIADVGGVVGRRLPSLSKHPYFLITSDLCDNYKDNVKKGDVLPLLGVVAKTSLSNQDFITAENQINQVLSQDKVVNKIHMRILNPDLTNPDLDENSSVVLKITLPNKTPLSLLQNDPTKKQEVQAIMQAQESAVGF